LSFNINFYLTSLRNVVHRAFGELYNVSRTKFNLYYNSFSIHQRLNGKFPNCLLETIYCYTNLPFNPLHVTVDLSSWKIKIDSDQTLDDDDSDNTNNTDDDDVGDSSRDSPSEIEKQDLAVGEHDLNKDGVLTIGCVGRKWLLKYHGRYSKVRLLRPHIDVLLSLSIAFKINSL